MFVKTMQNSFIWCAAGLMFLSMMSCKRGGDGESSGLSEEASVALAQGELSLISKEGTHMHDVPVYVHFLVQKENFGSRIGVSKRPEPEWIGMHILQRTSTKSVAFQSARLNKWMREAGEVIKVVIGMPTTSMRPDCEDGKSIPIGNTAMRNDPEKKFMGCEIELTKDQVLRGLYSLHCQSDISYERFAQKSRYACGK